MNPEAATSRAVVHYPVGRSGSFLRTGVLLLLLAGELCHFGVPLLQDLNPTLRGWWWPIIWNGRPVAEAVIGGALVAVFLSWPVFLSSLTSAVSEARDARTSHLNFWLVVHLGCAALVVAWLACGMRPGTFGAIGGALWFFAGIIFIALTAITWSAAIIPGVFWTRWVAGSPSAIVIGALVGVLSRSTGYFAQMLWPPLRYGTYVTVGAMLHALGLSVVSDPSRDLLGTPHFVVRIAPTCSGLEGIALICAFIAAYLWIYRADYRFPAALTLIPIGIAVVWVLNSVRITALILIGQWFSDVAVTGFHSVAGWIFFNLAAFGVVIASRHVPWITRTDEDSDVALSSIEGISAPNPALPYLVPILLTIGVAMLTAPFAAGFDAAYPARVIVGGIAVWWYRDRIATSLAAFSWTDFGLGVVCFLLWIVLTHHDRSADATIGNRLHSLPAIALMGWLAFRIAGAVIVIPIVEELAFRGYLMRKLIASEFESVPFGAFTWLSFVVSSVAFGALHQSWIAGVIAGALFALAMYRRGRLADAIAAHATANAMLAIYIVATGAWSLWT